ncbi:MAG TPA: hypothetical protein QGF05_09065 [Dehalococcoidia bacterium]|nr:hypothetical protein [Dehalococcoidia bacterium]
MDSSQGSDVREDDASAVYLDQPPFDVDGLEEVLSTVHERLRIRTFHPRHGKKP